MPKIIAFNSIGGPGNCILPISVPLIFGWAAPCAILATDVWKKADFDNSKNYHA